MQQKRGIFLSEDLIDKLHGIRGYHIEKIIDSADDIKIMAKAVEETAVCPQCGATGKDQFGRNLLNKDGKYTRKFSDIPINGKRTHFIVTDYRYYCTRCTNRDPLHKHKIFLPSFDDIAKPRARITNRLKEQIANESFKATTFEKIAERFFVDSSIVRDILLEKCAALDNCVCFEPVEVLGIDEIHKNKKIAYGVLVDGSSTPAKLIEMLPDKKKDTLIKALSRIRNPERVKWVTIDLTPAYRDAAYEVFPHCQVIIDRYHVIKYLLSATEEARKRAVNIVLEDIAQLPVTDQRAAQETWKTIKINHYWFKTDKENLTPNQTRQLAVLLEKYPVFRPIIMLKEKFRDIYASCQSSSEAEAAFKEWKNIVLSSHEDYLQPFISFSEMIERWFPCFISFFDVPPGITRTNGKTEAINGVLKRANHNGSGYKYEILRAKILYGDERIYVDDKGEFIPQSRSFTSALKSFINGDFSANEHLDSVSVFYKLLAATPNLSETFPFVTQIIYELRTCSTDGYGLLREYLLGGGEFSQMMQNTANQLDNNKRHNVVLIRASILLEELSNVVKRIAAEKDLGYDADEIIPVDSTDDKEDNCVQASIPFWNISTQR